MLPAWLAGRRGQVYFAMGLLRLSGFLSSAGQGGLFQQLGPGNQQLRPGYHPHAAHTMLTIVSTICCTELM